MERDLCLSPAMPNGRCRMHGGTSPGTPMGNRNAFKHGPQSCEDCVRKSGLEASLATADETRWRPLEALLAEALARADDRELEAAE